MKKLFFCRRPKGEKNFTPAITTIWVPRFTGMTEEAGRESLARFGPPGSGPDPPPPGLTGSGLGADRPADRRCLHYIFGVALTSPDC